MRAVDQNSGVARCNEASINYALGFADGLLDPTLRCNRPTGNQYADDFNRGLNDARDHSGLEQVPCATDMPVFQPC